MLIVCSRCNRQVETGETPSAGTCRCSCGQILRVPAGPLVAGKLSCPSCGAPVDPQLKHCNFCDTPLATVLCPRCFGGLFEGSQHCPHCGEALAGRCIVHGSETTHACPRCKDPALFLRVEVVSGFALERCARCEGFWVDRETVEKIYKKPESDGVLQSSIEAKAPRRHSRQATTRNLTSQGYIPCPVCGSLMNRQNFGRASGVLIDVCAGHGTWFDAEELRRILEFISSGGLEKAAQRERNKLREEIRRLESDKLLSGGSLGGETDWGGFGLGATHHGHSAVAVAWSVLKKLL